MLFAPLLVLLEGKILETAQKLCEAFGYSLIHPFQAEVFS